MVWRYDINLIEMAGNQPVHIIEIEPLLDVDDVKEFIRLDWKNLFKLRSGFIAVPFKDPKHQRVRLQDLESLHKAWNTASAAIKEATSKTIKCKHCTCSFPRSILNGAMCPMCFEVLGSHTNANRIKKWQEKLKDNAIPTEGISWYITRIKE